MTKRKLRDRVALLESELASKRTATCELVVRIDAGRGLWEAARWTLNCVQLGSDDRRLTDFPLWASEGVLEVILPIEVGP